MRRLSCFHMNVKYVKFTVIMVDFRTDNWLFYVLCLTNLGVVTDIGIQIANHARLGQ